ncbi:hypothetical protein E2C01_056427 [Portunus trituberculatus]|uniref:Uncharacterized protein n=1 Tax=Portunus trituberculatus TaxID=210409 RepID=A0A5B7GXD4_PORTR|nr:hypothetical protein [Portunus trituberculatus]
MSIIFRAIDDSRTCWSLLTAALECPLHHTLHTYTHMTILLHSSQPHTTHPHPNDVLSYTAKPHNSQSLTQEDKDRVFPPAWLLVRDVQRQTHARPPVEVPGEVMCDGQKGRVVPEQDSAGIEPRTTLSRYKTYPIDL